MSTNAGLRVRLTTTEAIEAKVDEYLAASALSSSSAASAPSCKGMPNVISLLEYLVGTEGNTGQANVSANHPTYSNPSKLHLLTTDIRKKIDMIVENYISNCSASHPNKLLKLTSAKKIFDEYGSFTTPAGGGGSLRKSRRKSRRKSHRKFCRKSRKSTRRH